jgi:ABC-type dipeptide/oligopeptide/nickel transport system permease subunit/ABC-type transport system substrate-binding protein
VNRSPWSIAARRFARSPAAMFGLVVAVLLVAFALLGPLFAAWAPDVSDFSMTRDAFGAPPGPSARHWLGTDAIFRDVASRLASGARVSLLVSLGATAVSSVVGTSAGLVAGTCAGGRFRVVDAALMRVVDVLLALPFLLFVTAVGAAVGRTDVGTMVLVLGLTGWTAAARLVRSKTLEVREREFVTAARALGAGHVRVALRHVLPNVAGPALVLATSLVGQMILAEAVLGYLTVGVQPPRATWGRMLHEAEPYLGSRLGLVAAPAIAILLSVLAFSRVGDGLRDALEPPRGAPPRRRWPFDAVIVAAVLCAVAVVSPPPPRGPGAAPTTSAASPKRGGTLHVATFLNLRSLDPALASDEVANAIDGLVFARLVTWDRDGKLAPELATSWRASPDGRTYTFELKRGVRFHDGAELAADDVKRSFERALAKGTPSPSASVFDMLDGFAAYRAGKAASLAGVRVVGDHAVAFDLAEPDAAFLARLTLGVAAPVCPSMGRAVDVHAPAAPCGAGPFRVAAFDPDRGVELARHAGYFDPGRPHLDAISWAVNVRPQTQRYEIEDGTLDYARDLTASDGASFRGQPAWAPYTSWSRKLSTSAVFMNTEAAPFTSRDVRRAVALALDPGALARVRGDIAETDRVLPAALDAGAPRGSLRRHDVAAALVAMARAGYAFDPATGRGGYPREVEFLAVPDTWDQQVGEIFQQQLARVGVRVRLKLVAYATFLAEVSRRGGAQMGVTGWNADFPDAANFFEPTLGSSAIADEGSQNVAFFSSPELDAVLARGRRELDPTKRAAIYAEAEAIVAREAPWVPTYTTRVLELWRPRVRGYAPHPLLPEDFRDVWLDDAPTNVALTTPLGRRSR